MDTGSRERRMRVLFYHANSVDIGGADYCLVKMVTQLDRTRFEPFVLLRLETPVCALYQQHGIETLVRPVLRLSRRQGTGYWLRLLPSAVRTVWIVARLVRRLRVDVVHGNDLLDFLASLGGRLGGAATVQHVRMFPPAGPLGTVIRRAVAALNHRVLCVSTAIRRSLGSPENAIVLYDWLDPERVGQVDGDGVSVRADLGVRPGKVVITVVGRLEPWKGQHLLVEAAPAILDACPDLEFWIVGGEVTGKEEYAANVRRRVEALGLAEMVRFLGDRRDAIAVMRASDVVVHTSVEPDPLPGVVMEAGLAGKIVVGPRAGGVPEEVPASNHWALYDRGDAASLACAVVRVLQHEDLSGAGLEAQRYVRERFDVCALSAAVESTYGDLARA